MMERRAIWALVGIAAAARVPFLWHGFGSHPDEWAVIRSGIDVWLRGEYHISRAPGYPLNEIMMGGLALVGGGPLCALAAAAAGVAAVVLFARLLRECGVAQWFWPAVAFAVSPWFWRCGTDALDYGWGVLCVLSAFVCVERGRWYRGAVWAGLGVGFRASAALWCLAVLVRVMQRERSWKKRGLFAGVMVGVGTVAVLPALLAAPGWMLAGGSYRLFLLTIETTVLWGYHLVEVYGHVPGVLALLAGVWFGRARLRAFVADRPGWLWAHGLLVVLFLALFLVHNQKLEYFLPAVPSTLLVLAQCLSRRWWQVVAVVFAVNGLVTIDVGSWSRSGFAFAVPHLEAGPLLADGRRRAEVNETVRGLAAALSERGRVVRVADRWDHFNALYVSGRLGRGPASQARAACAYVPVLVDPGSASLSAPVWLLDWPGLRPPAPPPKGRVRPGLVCCETGSIVTTEDNALTSEVLAALAAAYCGDVGGE